MKHIVLYICLIFTYTSIGHVLAADNLTRLKTTHISDNRKKAPSSLESMIPAILELDEGTSIESLLEKGIVVFHTRENLVLASVPESLADESLLDGVRRICTSRPSSVQLDRAKSWTGINDIHSGIIPGIVGHTGRNVVAGVCDIGFDPNHPAFIDAQTGRSRISHVVSYHETRGQREIIYPDQFREWKTDSADIYHATHVTGILGGSCRDHCYHGIAPEAELVVTLSELTDVGILSGAEDVIAYAHEKGLPAVINMSVGNYLGPHDGSTLVNKYLSLMGREAIICLAAGNEGSKRNSLIHRYAKDNEVLFPIYGTDWVHFDISGYVDIWSDDTRTLDVTLGVISSAERKLIYRSFTLDFGADGISGITSNREIANEYPYIKYDPGFAEYLDGTILAVEEVNPYNNRHNITMKVATHCPYTSNEGPWALYHPALIVGGKNGQELNAFADSQGLTFSYIPGQVIPDATMSVSDLACGDNVLCVGMYTTRSEVTTLDGNTMSFSGYVDNTVNPSSGYGTLHNGMVLPHVVAPGAMIISAISSPYLESHPERLSQMIATTANDGKLSYWGYDGGTSMATPFTAGTIALWLEAEPGLDIAQIHEIFRHTNDRDVVNPEDPRHGQGWIQPIEGLKYMLSNYAGIIPTENRPSSVYIDGTTVTILRQDALPATAAVYDFTGRCIVESTINTTSSMSIADNLERGAYILRVITADSRQPITLKLLQ